MLSKYFVVAAFSFALGVGATLCYLWTFGSVRLQDEFAILQASWSSDNKDWASFAKWLDAGGRSYWHLDTAVNGIRNAMSESEIRSVLGAPDLVSIGAEEYQQTASINQLRPLGAGRSRHQYIPILQRNTQGVYFYKTGRVAMDDGTIAHTVLEIQFDPNGLVTDRFRFAAAPDSVLADLWVDTRSSRLVRHSN